MQHCGNERKNSFLNYSSSSVESGVSVGVSADVLFVPLPRDFLLSLGVLSERSSSVVVDDALSSRSVGGRRAPVDRVLRVAFSDPLVVALRSVLAGGVACACVEALLLGEDVPPAVVEATSPGLTVAPAVPVTSVAVVVPLDAATSLGAPGVIA